MEKEIFTSTSIDSSTVDGMTTLLNQSFKSLHGPIASRNMGLVLITCRHIGIWRRVLVGNAIYVIGFRN